MACAAGITSGIDRAAAFASIETRIGEKEEVAKEVTKPDKYA